MLWIKALHIIAVICWFAGLFYLPRLFVYHSMSNDKISRERFEIMERKLYRGIMTPSMVATIALGIWLVADNIDFYRNQLWLQVKFALVLILVVYHFICGKYVKQLAQDICQHSDKFFRFFNEFPVLIMVAIVILVVDRPF